MSKDNQIKAMLSDKVCMTPNGFVADQLNPDQFADCYELFFDNILEISSADLSGVQGYGEINEDCKTAYATCEDFSNGYIR